MERVTVPQLRLLTRKSSSNSEKTGMYNIYNQQKRIYSNTLTPLKRNYKRKRKNQKITKNKVEERKRDIDEGFSPWRFL